MKKYIILLILAITATTSFAQLDSLSDTLKEIVPYSKFPVGAYRKVNDSILTPMLGMNFNWDGFNEAGENAAFTAQGTPTDSLHDTVVDPLYYDTTGTITQSRIRDSILFEAAFGKDARIYMPGTSGLSQEYYYSWKNVSGGIDSSIGASGAEWKIGISGLTSGQYILDSLQGVANVNGDATTEPYANMYGTGQPALNANHVGSFSYEFVYFFDTVVNRTIWNSLTSTQPLYALEYHLITPKDTILAFDTITKAIYQSESLANTPVAADAVHADSLANWYSFQTSNYKLLRHIINLRPYYTNSFTTYPTVDVRLITFAQIPIYVRLLRIRDWVAQQVLTGKADSLLSIAIRDLKAHNGNSHLKSWNIKAEPYPVAFHSMGYINDLLIRDTAPPMNTMSPWWFADLFPRIIRDQSRNYAKAIVYHEWEPYGFFWRGIGITGGHPSWYLYSNYDSTFFNQAPIPATYATNFHSDSIYWAHRLIWLDSNYDDFTQLNQQRAIGFYSETPGTHTGKAQTITDIARSCYELDPAHPVAYQFSPPALGFFNLVPQWKYDSLRYEMNDSIYSYRLAHGSTTSAATDTASNISSNWYDTVYSTFAKNYVTSQNPDTILTTDNMYDVQWVWRPATSAELYYDFWTGVAHAMKSYNLNCGLDDLLADQGFLYDSSNPDGSMIYETIKSQNRDWMYSRFYKLTDPVTSTGAVPVYYAWDDSTYRYTKMDVPPAYHELLPIERDIITEELAPIVDTLASLQYNGFLSWHKRFAAPTYLSRLPIKNLTTTNLLGSRDSDAETFVDIGIMKHPVDTTARFVVLINRRLWCDPTNTLTKDYRLISFRVEPSAFGDLYEHCPRWEISDTAGMLPDKIITQNDFYSFTVKPGQGKLFRIAPVDRE